MEHEYYKILGVAKTATPDEIKKAYLKLARENHPDRFRDPTERAEADSRFQLITEAYNHLRDDKLRREYDRSLDRKVRPPDEEARLYFKNGEFREQSKDWENALKLYYEAMRLQPDNLEYIVAAGRVLAMDKSKQRQASELFERAIEKDPKAPEPYLQLGALFMRSKMFLRAKRVYENALKQIPHHPDLKRQLAESEAAEKKSRGRR
jgi:curved DNA-binding protein CbpA